MVLVHIMVIFPITDIRVMVVQGEDQVDIVMEVQEVVVQDYRVKDSMVEMVVPTTTQVVVEVLVQWEQVQQQLLMVEKVSFQVF